jgi:hypothetical protein
MLNENCRRSSWAFLTLLFASNAWAQTPFSSEQMGLGGAGVARTDSSGFRNAAAMMLEPGFYTYSEVKWGHGFSLGQALREVRSDTAVGASFGYSWAKSNFPPTLDEMPGWIEPGEVLTNARKSRDFRGAGGIRLLGGRLALGLGGNVLRDDSELGGVQSFYQMDVSAAGQLAEGVSMAVGARNLLAEGEDPLRLELGLWWSAVETFHFAIDAIFEEGVVQGRVGGELGLGPAIRLRGGGYFSEEEQGFGAGFALLGEGTRLDYSLSAAIGGPENNGPTHSLTVFVAVPARK